MHTRAPAEAGRPQRPKASRPPAPPPDISPELEQRVGITVGELAAIYALDAVRGFGPQKFRQLHESGIEPGDLLTDPGRLPTEGKKGEQLRAGLRRVLVFSAVDRLAPTSSGLDARLAKSSAISRFKMHTDAHERS